MFLLFFELFLHETALYRRCGLCHQHWCAVVTGWVGRRLGSYYVLSVQRCGNMLVKRHMLGCWLARQAIALAKGIRAGAGGLFIVANWGCEKGSNCSAKTTASGVFWAFFLTTTAHGMHVLGIYLLSPGRHRHCATNDVTADGLEPFLFGKATKCRSFYCFYTIVVEKTRKYDAASKYPALNRIVCYGCAWHVADNDAQMPTMHT
jgi:hypothetical protein